MLTEKGHVEVKLSANKNDPVEKTEGIAIRLRAWYEYSVCKRWRCQKSLIDPSRRDLARYSERSADNHGNSAIIEAGTGEKRNVGVAFQIWGENVPNYETWNDYWLDVRLPWEGGDPHLSLRLHKEYFRSLPDRSNLNRSWGISFPVGYASGTRLHLCGLG